VVKVVEKLDWLAVISQSLDYRTAIVIRELW
jgi:hypothetical protein